MTDQPVEFSSKPKRIIIAQRAIHKPSGLFHLEENLHNFDRLKPGQVIATNGSKQYIAKEGECIIFPHYKARIGEEAYIIAVEK